MGGSTVNPNTLTSQNRAVSTASERSTPSSHVANWLINEGFKDISLLRIPKTIWNKAASVFSCPIQFGLAYVLA